MLWPTSTPHTDMQVCIMTAPLPIQLPVDANWEAVDDGSSTWPPATHVGAQTESQVPGLGLAQVWLLQAFGE